MRTRFDDRTLPSRLQLGLAVVIATGAGLLWLTQSDGLAATGRRIARLQYRRADLIERRAEALITLATATDPRLRSARARALGYGPPPAVIELTVMPAAADVARRSELPADSPLAIEIARMRQIADMRGGGLPRLLHLGAQHAVAAERPGGWGGAR